jgi:hypothetical protein
MLHLGGCSTGRILGRAAGLNAALLALNRELDSNERIN